MTYGRTRHFAPYSIQRPNGFVGGPSGYQEMDTLEIAAAW